jgi:hypothetical protein
VLLRKARMIASLKWTLAAVTKDYENTGNNNNFNKYTLCKSRYYYSWIYTITNTS